MDLVVDEMAELEHVDVAHGDHLLEGLAGHPVHELRLPGAEHVRPQRVALPLRLVRLHEVGLDLRLARAVEDGAREVQAEDLGRTPQVGLQDLPTFMRDGTPSGFRTISPASRPGGTHVLFGQDAGDDSLLPWRPAILSPTDSLRFMATNTLTSLMTPGGSSSPRFRRLSFSANSAFSTSICRSVLSTISESSPSTSSSSRPFTLSFRMSEWRSLLSASRVSS